jgi:hypothetical protein
MSARFVPLSDGTMKLIDTGSNPVTPDKMPQKLDFNRGAVMVYGSAGMTAYYADDPGRYLDAQGNEVSENEARLNGIDVLKQAAERRSRQARDKAFEDIERRYQAERDAQEAALAVPVPQAERTPEPVYAVPSKSADALSADVLTGKAKS